MWSSTYSKRVKDVSADQVWSVWTDVNQWTSWQNDLELARLEHDFKAGTKFLMRPKGGPNVNIELLRVERNRNFTDLTRFPLARMTGSHDLIEHGDELEVRTTMKVEGLLSFLWVKIVANDVAKGLEAQTDALLKRVRTLHG
jgi:uncharacterized protein YndB with AHSA1/START domain